MFKITKYIVFSVIFLIALCLQTSPVDAARPISALKGWAWSDTIGWISLNCLDGGPRLSDGTNQNICSSTNANYAVNVDATTGDLSGFAWSDNIGWISFNCGSSNPDSGCGNDSFPTGFGTLPQKAQLTTANSIVGWARAASAVGRTDGWDGWISLSGATLNGGMYGVFLKFDNISFEGFAAGTGYEGNTGPVDWISFALVSGVSEDVEVTLTANPPTVPATIGGETTLTWTSTNAATCTTSASPSNSSWTIAPSATSSNKTLTVTRDTDFRIDCIGTNGSTDFSTTTVILTTDGGSSSCPDGQVMSQGICVTIVTDPTPGSCSLANGDPIVSGKIYYKAPLVRSGLHCEGAQISCTVDGLGVVVFSPSNYLEYTYPTCRVSADIIPI